MMITTADQLRRILTSARTIAVVGASPKPYRDSGAIAQFLLRKGYSVYLVNPKYSDINGLTCYPDLKSLPEKIDIVDIFRCSEGVGPIVDEAIQIGAGCVWMQLDVVNEAAAQKAEDADLDVVMDRCIAIEHRSLLL